MKKYALISVYDKTGIVEFAKRINNLGYEIISTGGTAQTLISHSIPIIPISQITGNPESFDGRMKTISFQIESGILFDRSNIIHRKEAKQLKIKPIDIVVCNFYPFESKRSIENIDVGGPTMVRSAAKNFKHVLVVVNPADYKRVDNALTGKKVNDDLRQELAAYAFSYLSYYDSQIAHFINKKMFPEHINISGKLQNILRYGENPHQQAALYIEPQVESPFQYLKKHAGRDLSLTNITDINAGIESTRMFKEPSAVIIKHNSPCGIALGKTIDDSLKYAMESDPESAFGGIVVLNKPMTMKAAQLIQKFKKDGRGNMDIIAAPEFEKDVIDFLVSVRKTTGLYSYTSNKTYKSYMSHKPILGGFILQNSDDSIEEQFISWKVVTKNKPTEKQLKQMQIGWKFASKIKSNTILVIDKNIPMTRGIGNGQTSRIRSAKIAFEQAGLHAKNGILVSDSFFPFDDAIKLAAKYQIGAIVQQGGSINDQLSIDAANKARIPMIFTGYRAFWH